MQALCALEQHKALVTVSERLFPTERLLAFLDDLCVLCSPDRVADVHVALQHVLREYSRILVHHGKTQIWNSSAAHRDLLVGSWRSPICRVHGWCCSSAQVLGLSAQSGSSRLSESFRLRTRRSAAPRFGMWCAGHIVGRGRVPVFHWVPRFNAVHVEWVQPRTGPVGLIAFTLSSQDTPLSASR